MSDEASTPSSKPAGSDLLENQRLYKLFISKISEKVNKDIRKRNADFRAWLIGILTLVVFSFAASGTVVLRGYVDDAVAPAVKEAVDLAVKEAVDLAVKEATDALQFDLEIASLNFRMVNLDRSESFTSEEAESIIEDINSLVSRGAKEKLRKLEFATNTAVESFAAADRLDLVLRLQDIAPDLFQNSGTITQTLLQASGFMLLADAGAPNSWTDTTGSRSGIYKIYRTYADRAELAGYRGLYLLHEVLLGYIEGRSAEEIGNLIADIDSLDEADSEHFVLVMTPLASGEVTKELTAQSRRVVSRVTAFLCEYKEQSYLLQIVFQQAALRCQAQNP